jgi:thiol-disulfide isomerase/thioredoxin
MKKHSLSLLVFTLFFCVNFCINGLQLRAQDTIPKFVSYHLSNLQTLDSLIATQKGNVVYIDFWASWCRPCMRELMNSKPLYKAFEGEKVVFVYISLDENEEYWRKAIAWLQLGGYQFRLDGVGAHKKTDVEEKYNIHAIPRYMLADKQGNIVNTNAERPSNLKAISKEIKKLLSE